MIAYAIGAAALLLALVTAKRELANAPRFLSGLRWYAAGLIVQVLAAMFRIGNVTDPRGLLKVEAWATLFTTAFVVIGVYIALGSVTQPRRPSRQ